MADTPAPLDLPALMKWLRERVAKLDNSVTECAEDCESPRPNYINDDGYEHYEPCKQCLRDAVNAQALEDAANALTTLTLQRDQEATARESAQREVARLTALLERVNDTTLDHAADAQSRQEQCDHARDAYSREATARAEAERERDALRAELATLGAAARVAMSNLEWRKHNFPGEHGSAVRDEAIQRLTPLLSALRQTQEPPK